MKHTQGCVSEVVVTLIGGPHLSSWSRNRNVSCDAEDKAKPHVRSLPCIFNSREDMWSALVLPNPRDNELYRNWPFIPELLSDRKPGFLYVQKQNQPYLCPLYHLRARGFLSFFLTSCFPERQAPLGNLLLSHLPSPALLPPPSQKESPWPLLGLLSGFHNPCIPAMKFVSGFSQDDQLRKASFGLLAPPFPPPARVSLGSMGSHSFLPLRRARLKDCACQHL